MRTLLPYLLPLLACGQAPPQSEATAPVETEGQVEEAPYLMRRRTKLEARTGLLAQAESSRRLGLDYRDSGVGGEALEMLRRAEAMYLAGLDAATYAPDRTRFSLARAETARMMKINSEALQAYARAVALAGPRPEDDPAPGLSELKEILVELDAADELDAVLTAAREDVVQRHAAELQRFAVDRPAPAFELERPGGDAFSSKELAGKISLLWIWNPSEEASRAELTRVIELAKSWDAREELRLIGIVLPHGESEEAMRALERAGAFSQLRGTKALAEELLVFDSPAAAIFDATGQFRYASSGQSPFTVEALGIAVEELAGQ